jgi:hypothetical protein
VVGATHDVKLAAPKPAKIIRPDSIFHQSYHGFAVPWCACRKYAFEHEIRRDCDQDWEIYFIDW